MKKLNLGYGDIVGLMLIAMSLFGTLAITSAGQTINNTAGSTIISTLCSVFNTIKTVIFILAITLFVLGGVLYAGANMMPSSQRGTFQGYGMAMIIGAIIGIAIVIAAPYVLSIVVRANPNAINNTVSSTIGGNGGGSAAANGLCSTNANNGAGGDAD